MTPQQAQAELARRELARRERSRTPTMGDVMSAVNPLTAPAWAADQVARRNDALGAGVAGLREGLSFSWADELGGVQAGLGAMMRGQQYGPAFQQERDRMRQNLETHQTERPFSTGAGQLTGALLTGFAPGGMVARGMGPAGRLLTAGGTGAAAAGTYAAGAAPTDAPTLAGDIQQRLPAAGEGAALGALLGGGFQGAFEVASPLIRAGRRWFSGATGHPTVPGRMGVAETARQDMLATARSNPVLMQRARQYMEQNPGATLEDALIAEMRQTAAADPTLTTAEVFGQSGQGRLASIARAPGETGQRVEDFFTARARNQPDELEAVLAGRAPATGDALEQQVREQWRTRGPELYEPLLGARPEPRHLQAFQALLSSDLFKHRAIQSAWRRADDMIRDDIALGRIAPGAVNSIRHQLHYAKVALDEMIEDPTRLEPGLRNMNNASIAAARDQLLRRMESVIPGYNAARSQMADIGAARRAIEAGRQAFTRQRFASDAALQRYVQSLSPGERPYFLAGAEEAMGNMMATAGRDGRRNVANTFLNDRFRARLRAILGDEAGPVLERVRQIGEKFEFGSRVRPSQGSITSNVLLQNFAGAGIGAGTGMANAQDDPIMGALTGGVLGFGLTAAARRAGSNFARNTIERGAQRQRDVLGRVYLTPVGEFETMSGGLIRRAQREAKRRAARDRLLRTRGAVYAGVGSAGIVDPREDER